MDETKIHYKMLIVTSISALGNIIMLLFAVKLIFKVHKLVQWTDLPMIFSIISLALASLFMLIFNIWALIGCISDEKAFINSTEADSIANIFDGLKITFIFHAFLYDLYKWCVFLAATGTDIS